MRSIEILIGAAAEKLVRHGMLVEHDLGRLYMQELEAAIDRVAGGDEESRLDIIANAVSYTHLLHRHVDKEDGVVYKYAKNNLSKETLDKLNEECMNLEHDERTNAVRQKYLDLIDEMEHKL